MEVPKQRSVGRVLGSVGGGTRSSESGSGHGSWRQKARAVGSLVSLIILSPLGVVLGGRTGFGHGPCLQQARTVGTQISVFISVLALRYGPSHVVLFPKGSAGGVLQQASSVLMGPL